LNYLGNHVGELIVADHDAWLLNHNIANSASSWPRPYYDVWNLGTLDKKILLFLLQ